jgi:tryptophanyl-tRNA synthetase
MRASRTADTFFMMADMHAITVPHEPKELLASTRSTTALYLACGINPDKAAVFVQSHVSAHAELAWMLQCYTPIGWLRKMIQFKTKSEKQVGGHVLPGEHHWRHMLPVLPLNME